MEELTPKQVLALCHLAAGATSQEAASAAGVSLSSVEHWRIQPNFKRLLRESTAKLYDEAIAELVLGAKEAVKELKRIIEDTEVADKTKISAIRCLLSGAEKAKEALLEERLERLEERLDGSNAN